MARIRDNWTITPRHATPRPFGFLLGARLDAVEWRACIHDRGESNGEVRAR